MSDTERTVDSEDGPASSAVVPAVGSILSAVAIVALVIPARQGVDTPAVWIAVAAAVVTTGSFLARRHDLLERRVAGPVATGSSLLVVVLSGYAITQGILGSVAVPGLEWSISLLFVAFFVGIGTVGVGTAEFAGISGQGLLRRLARSVELLILGVIGLFAPAFAELFLSLPLVIAGAEATELQGLVLQYLGFGVGLGAVAVGYLAFRESDRSFIDLERPTLRTVGWIVAGLVVILGANMGISFLMEIAGIEGSEHSLTQDVTENPDLLLVMVPAMLFIVGPFEELLYRNLIQKTLYGTFSRYGAVVVASVVFTLVHVSAYATAGAGEILASLSLLFVLSLILGTIYERTENLLVPALVHGGYNAVVVLMIVV